MLPDLPDVAQQRTATLVKECEADVLQANATYRIQYMGDTLLHAGTPGGQGALAYASDAALPAARRIERMDLEGPAELITDNGPAIDARVAADAAAALAGRGDPVRTDPAQMECSNVCCTQGDPCGWQWNGQCDCGVCSCEPLAGPGPGPGCACSTPGGSADGPGAGWLLGLCALVALRRRR